MRSTLSFLLLWSIFFTAFSQAPSAIVQPSDSVRFTAGGAGAVSRNLAFKLDDYKSVRDYGAVGDSLHDDAAALQAAFNQATNILIPPGKYVIKSPLTLPEGNYIISGYNAIIYYTGNQNALTLKKGFQGTLEGLTVYGINAHGHGLVVSPEVRSYHLKGIRVKKFADSKKAGILLAGGYSGTISDQCVIQSNYYGIHKPDSSQAGQYLISDNYVLNNAVGISLLTAGIFTIFRNNIECNQIGMNLEGVGGNVTYLVNVFNNNFEGNLLEPQPTALLVKNTFNVNVQGNAFRHQGTPATAYTAADFVSANQEATFAGNYIAGTTSYIRTDAGTQVHTIGNIVGSGSIVDNRTFNGDGTDVNRSQQLKGIKGVLFQKGNDDWKFELKTSTSAKGLFLQYSNTDRAVFSNEGGLSVKGNDDLVTEQPNRGLVVKTPDGTKRYRISVDNSGNLTTTLVP
jgi:hypothetical protein